MDSKRNVAGSSRQAPAADLPQWNSRFRFSAQKGASDESKDLPKVHSHQKHLASGARRVPAGKAGTTQSSGTTGGTSHGHAPTPVDLDKTPTVCLFQRFESLTLTTPAAAKRASRNSAITPSQNTILTSTAAAAAAEGCKEAPAGSGQRRSVAFGTPSVLTYTPAAPTDAGAQQQSTPLWSNAGHTPYSLSGKSSGGCIQAVCEAGDEPSLISASSEVRMELFSSIIGESEVQQTPIAFMAAPRTPGDPLAVTESRAAMQLAGEAAGEPSREQSVDSEEQDMMLTPLSSARVAATDSNNCSFTGFGAGVVNATDVEEESTPPFFGRTGGILQPDAAAAANSCDSAANTPEVAGDDANHATSAAVATGPTDSSGTSCTPCAADGRCCTSEPTTSKSRLRQPARVPMEGNSKPAITLELKQLLCDPQAAAAVHPAVNLGTCEVLSPVRPKKQLQQALGAADQVLSPVRRSARKAAKQLNAPSASAVTPMLEATNYCYKGRGDVQPFAS